MNSGLSGINPPPTAAEGAPMSVNEGLGKNEGTTRFLFSPPWFEVEGQHSEKVKMTVL